MLTDKSSRPNKNVVSLDKIPDKSFKKSSITSPATKNNAKSISEDNLTKMRQAMGLSDNEFVFLKDYRRLEELEREKGIKFFQCIGDPPATDDFKSNVVVQRQNFVEVRQSEMREKDVSRFATECNKDKVVVPIDVDLRDKPKWNVYENNHFAMRKRLVGIFLKVTNKLITRIRAGKRLLKIKNRIKAEGITSKADMQRLVAED